MSPLTEPTKLTLARTYVGVDDPDAADYIAAVEAADEATSPGVGALETATKVAIHSFVKGCKADGIWDAIKASCILAGARTLNGALVPLVGTAPTNNNFVSGDYNRKTGLKGNGSTKSLDSNLAANSLPLNSNHLAVRVTSPNTLGDRVFMGTNTSNNCEMGAYFSSNSVFGSRNNTPTPDLSAPANSGFLATFYGISRADSSNYIRRYNSTSATISIASSGLSSGNYSVFARNTPSGYCNARIAFYSIGESLDLALLDARVTDLINKFAEVIP